MKNIQNAAILIVLLALVANTLYEKFANRPLPIAPEERFESEVFHIVVPDTMSFCGEPVPLKESFVRERFDQDLNVNAFFHSNTIMLMKRANRWFPQMRAVLKSEGIPEDFLYIAAIESNLQNNISPRGATGFWQFMENTAKEIGLEVTEEVDERYDPMKSTWAACKYFKQAHRKFGNWTLVAASYNMGMAGLESRVVAQKARTYYDLDLNAETARYVFRILAIKEVLSNPKKYKFSLPASVLYQPNEVKYVEVKASIADLAEFAQSQGISYAALKHFNPWLRSNKLTVKGDKTYKIAIPAGSPDLDLEG